MREDIGLLMFEKVRKTCITYFDCITPHYSVISLPLHVKMYSEIRICKMLCHIKKNKK